MNPMPPPPLLPLLNKVVSGGQTGADQAALVVAAKFNLATGGWAPKGFLTETGASPWLGSTYGLVEHVATSYAVRTLANVRDSDMTVWFGNETSMGGR